MQIGIFRFLAWRPLTNRRTHSNRSRHRTLQRHPRAHQHPCSSLSVVFLRKLWQIFKTADVSTLDADLNGVTGTDWDWAYTTTEQSGMDGRTIGWPRGKVLGGSSAIK